MVFHTALLANVAIISDLNYLQKYGAMGIGLYRTEFPFMARHNFPSREEQTEIYTKVVKSAPEADITIRTMDIGGDKHVKYLNAGMEENPFLGWRSIRISLDMIDTFKEQLKAIYEVSVLGKVKIMFPMICGVDEIRKVKALIVEVKQELRKENIPFNENTPIGIMVEVPSAVLTLESLIREIDFLSIGTNDLIQYTLAVDRNNEKVANYYDPFHPAVLKLIHHTIEVAHANGKPVSLCGEMASDPKCALVLLGMGLERFSMSAYNIPLIKQLIRSIKYDDAIRITEDVLRLDTSEKIHRYIDEIFKELELDKALQFNDNINTVSEKELLI